MADDKDFPQRIQSNLLKSMPAAAPEIGSKLSLASIRTQASSFCVASAIVASSTVVFPDEAEPQISVKQPRGMPPAIAFNSAMPVESISGLGRTSNRDAGRTATRRSERVMCLKMAAFFPSNPAGKNGEGLVFNGRVDIETSRQKDLGWYCPVANQSFSLFIRLREFCYRIGRLSSEDWVPGVPPSFPRSLREGGDFDISIRFIPRQKSKSTPCLAKKRDKDGAPSALE